MTAPLTTRYQRVLTDAADHGHTEAVRLMLDLGFPPDARSEQDDGATAPHLAAATGSVPTVRLLLDQGAILAAGVPWAHAPYLNLLTLRRSSYPTRGGAWPGSSSWTVIPNRPR